MEKRYNISLEYEQLVLLFCAIRRATRAREERNKEVINDHWTELMNDALSRVNKAMDRAHKEMGV